MVGQCDAPVVFSKIVKQIERVKPWFFLFFFWLLRHILPEHFIEIYHVFERIRRFPPSILTTFINFSDFFLHFIVTKKLIMSVYKKISGLFYFQSTLNWFVSNCIKLYWIRLVFLEIWRGRGGVKWTSPPPKNLLSKSPALLGLQNRKIVANV